MSFDLLGRTALVTGASRGIGRALATGLANAGATVVLAARDEGLLNEVQSEIQAGGGVAHVIAADLTSAEQCAGLIESAIAFNGALDVLVNNAGGSSYMGPFTDMRFSGWEKVMQLNVESIVHLSQAAGRHMIARGGGSIINVASIAGLTGLPLLAPYAASKAAVVSLTKSLALEWGPHGVRVNALCPGWTKTELNTDIWGGPDQGKELVSRQGIKRWAETAEMVGPTVFLASDASSYVTGHVLAVDGGHAAA